MRTSSALLLVMLMGALGSPAYASNLTIQSTDVTFTFDPSVNLISYPGQVVTAQAVGNSATVPTINSQDGTTTFTITLDNPNDRFTGLSLIQHGDYFVSGSGASVSMSGSLTAVGGSLSSSGALTPQAPLNSTAGLTNWTAMATTDLSSAQWASVRSITVTIRDSLSAEALLNYNASISAGMTGSVTFPDSLNVGVSTVPLTSSAVLMFSGLLGLFALGLARVRS